MMSLHMIKNHIKKQSGHISPPSPGEMLLNSFLKETQKQKWKTEEKQNLFRKLKTFLAFLLKKVQQQSLAD